MKAELLLENDTQLGEGPVWDYRINTLFWVDILKGYVQAYDYASGKNTIYEMGEYVGAVVPTDQQNLVVALQNRIVIFDQGSKHIQTICIPEPDYHTNRFNDGKCDAKGRFWIGSTQIDHKAPTGTLYCVPSDETYIKKLDHLQVSNGIAWSSDNKTMYFIDSPTYKVQAFDFDLERGALTYRKDIITFDPQQGTPDGLCTDNEGNLWIALYGGGKVVCCDPNSGMVVDYVTVPAQNTTSCCFGAPDLDTLFITSAKDHVSKGGGLYCCKPGINGPKANFYTTK